jgi:hypothetical protein
MEELNAERARAFQHEAHKKHQDEDQEMRMKAAESLYEKCLSAIETRAKQGNSYALVEWSGWHLLREDFDTVMLRLSEKGFKCEFKEATNMERYDKIMIVWR